MSDEENKHEKPIVIRNTTDLQRLKLEKLMKNPDKPIIIPERPKERGMPIVPDFVRNVMGSSAGAGSGEFHVYRHLRRKEYARQKYMKERGERERIENDYHSKLEENKQKAAEKTAKKRAKRLKRKQKMKTKRPKVEVKSDSSESEEDDDEDDAQIDEVVRNETDESAKECEVGESNVSVDLKENGETGVKNGACVTDGGICTTESVVKSDGNSDNE